MAHVALMTIGLLRAPWGDPLVRGFEDRLDETFAMAASSPGYVGRVGPASGWWDGGAVVVPSAFAGPEVDDRIAKTLSVWRDAESAFAFSYRGMHGASLRMRHDWFVKVDTPSHVAWWIDEGHVPTWAEAAARHDELVASGPTARAFEFRAPFGADGRPYAIDREMVRGYAPSPTSP